MTVLASIDRGVYVIAAFLAVLLLVSIPLATWKRARHIFNTKRDTISPRQVRRNAADWERRR